jgi:CheY-like chemotaxis protein
MTTSRSKSSTIQARILLVDDNRSGLAARKAVLEELGHRVTPATGGEDALEHFARAKYDMVITDHRMPKMDGIELIKRVRSVNPEIPVIMISGYVEALGLNEANTGADVILLKSANEVTHLLRSAGRLLRRKTPKKPPARQRPAAKATRAGT